MYRQLPMKPHARQTEFLQLDCEEALFGGAAGGGKTEALLMWLAEGVHIPGYNAVIYRRYQTDTSGDESALLAKSAKLYPALGGKLVGLRWVFQCPGGGTSSITLDGVAHENSVLSAQGKEFHRMAFDELTHFTEFMFNFLVTTRMRKVRGFPIKCGVRCSANPGGPGHGWVKDRFITDEAILAVKALDINQPTPQGMIFWKDANTAYVPSRAVDNPALDVEDYIKRLMRNKNPVERARMMNGDWGISPEGLIKPNWLRYYTMRDQMVDLLVSRPDGNGGIIHTDEVLTSFHVNTCRRFTTVDTAGGMKDITRESKGKPLSWTVAETWDTRRIGNKIVIMAVNVWRDRVGFTDVCRKLKEIHSTYGSHRIRIEDKTMGPDIANLMLGALPIDLIPTGTQDKVTRATPLLNMLEQGCVYLPKFDNSWRPVLEEEWLSWQGLEDETNDQVDAAAYAAIEAGGFTSGIIKADYDPRQPLDQALRTSQAKTLWR